MKFILIVLAVAGFVAALRRLAFAAFRLIKGGVDSYVMRELGSVRAERGDLTGLREAHDWRRKTRVLRARAGLAVLFWAALLSVPLMTRRPLPIFAAYAALWLLPRRRKVVSP